MSRTSKYFSNRLDNWTYMFLMPKEIEVKPATGKWKNKIKKVANDFEVDYEIIIKYVESNMKGDEGDEILYERAQRKMMSLVFG